MSYIKAEDVLPRDIIEIIQKYIDGQNIYIPKKSDTRTKWGERTDTLSVLSARNNDIYTEYRNGSDIKSLAEKYFLSEKSIQRIIYQAKPRANPERVCSSFFIKIYEVVFHNNIKYNYTIKYLKGRRYNGFN